MRAQSSNAALCTQKMIMVASYVCVIFLKILLVQSQELAVNTTAGKGDVLDIEISTNYTIQDRKAEENVTLDKSTQPSQQIEMTLGKSNVSVNDKLDFRPSPQLETIYEYNKFPVVPAMPEAKHITGLNTGEFSLTNPDRNPWRKTDFQRTTEQPWVNRVSFPQPTVATVRDRPYPFLTSNSPHPVLTSKTYGVPQDSSIGPYSKPNRPEFTGYGTSFGGSGNGWNKFEKTGLEKTQLEYAAPEKHPSAYSISPLKKIISILAAFIPIGLLISALTPTVIQVTPVNMT